MMWSPNWLLGYRGLAETLRARHWPRSPSQVAAADGQVGCRKLDGTQEARYTWQGRGFHVQGLWVGC